MSTAEAPVPCPICSMPVDYFNLPGRQLLICDNCGRLKDFLSGRQVGGDPRYEVDRG